MAVQCVLIIYPLLSSYFYSKIAIAWVVSVSFIHDRRRVHMVLYSAVNKIYFSHKWMDICFRWGLQKLGNKVGSSIKLSRKTNRLKYVFGLRYYDLFDDWMNSFLLRMQILFEYDLARWLNRYFSGVVSVLVSHIKSIISIRVLSPCRSLPISTSVRWKGLAAEEG